MNNTVDLIRKDLVRHRVCVILPGKREEKFFYLIMIKAKTRKLDDFKKTYGEQATATHIKIAKKIFSEGETENVYGVFVDENLRMVFAFNRDFADYDKGKEKVVYKDIDDVLVDNINPAVLPFPIPRLPNRNNFPKGGGALMKYSLAEKE